MYKDKDFKYVPPAKENRKTGYNKNKSEEKNNKPGRIRVQAGDKCVPPAKSKPKKRKAVGPQDESTLSMDSVQWSEKSHEVKPLLDTYSNRFPLLVKVTKGYSGKLSPRINTGKVIQIHSSGHQKRVLAFDSQKRQLSIPISYPIEVTVLEVHDRVWMSLKNVVLSRSLPLKVRIMKMSTNSEDYKKYNLVGEDLELTALQEEYFLRGNSITDNGWLDQLDISLMPSFLNTKFSVATGMRGATPEEWNDYQGMYKRSIRHLNFKLLDGYKDIYVNCDSPYPLQSYDTSLTKPLPEDTALSSSKVFFDENLSEPPEEVRLYENLPTDERQNRKSANIYDNVGFVHDDQKTSKSRTPDKSNAPHFANHNDNVEEFIIQPDIHEPPVSRSGTPFSEIDENDVEIMFDNVIRIGQETLEKKQLEDSYKLAGTSDNEQIPMQILTDNHANGTGNVTRRKANTEENMYQSHIDISSTTSYAQTKSNKLDANPVSVPDRTSKSNIHSRGSYISETSSGTPMGVIQPLVLQKKTSFRNDPQAIETQTVITSMEDVPENVVTLTVADVCKCLQLLNMDTHIAEFRRHQIDGKLLNDLRENDLSNEFHFTPFNASKLLRFVRGWRPKFI